MKQKIILNQNDSFEVSHLKFSRGEAYYASVKYPHHNPNQDSLAIFELPNNKLVLVVSDGMGGHRAGEVASKIICDTFQKELLSKSKNLRNRILDAIEKSNKAILKLGTGSGATLTCCSIEKNKIRFFNIGDSSQFLLGSRGKIKFKGIEHSPLGHGIEAGIIQDRTEQDIVEGNVVSNGVGFKEMRIEMSTQLEISEGDLVVLSSDGIRDLMNEKDFISWATTEDFHNRVKNIINNFENGEQNIEDDSTVILYKHAST